MRDETLDREALPAEARYLFDPLSIRRSDEPSEEATRLIWMFLQLLRKREIVYAAYAKQFRRGEKTFQRDIAKLRTIGTDYDFSITRRQRGCVKLAGGSAIVETRKGATEITADTLRAVADALGELVSTDIYAAIDTASAPIDPFLRLAVPKLIDQTGSAIIYRQLREAWRQHARVRFRYPQKKRREILEERTVEPHLVTYYDGRYYLVAFDARPRTMSWRQFALDRIVGPIARSGTFKRRIVPFHYCGEDALGLFKSNQAVNVSIAISPEIALSVLARRWQRDQKIQSDGSGWPIVIFTVFDVAEAVRWAFGFGSHARVVGPEDAVVIATKLASDVLASYAVDFRQEA